MLIGAHSVGPMVAARIAEVACLATARLQQQHMTRPCVLGFLRPGIGLASPCATCGKPHLREELSGVSPLGCRASGTLDITDASSLGIPARCLPARRCRGLCVFLSLGERHRLPWTRSELGLHLFLVHTAVVSLLALRWEVNWVATGSIGSSSCPLGALTFFRQSSDDVDKIHPFSGLHQPPDDSSSLHRRSGQSLTGVQPSGWKHVACPLGNETGTCHRSS